MKRVPRVPSDGGSEHRVPVVSYRPLQARQPQKVASDRGNWRSVVKKTGMRREEEIRRAQLVEKRDRQKERSANAAVS